MNAEQLVHFLRQPTLNIQIDLCPHLSLKSRNEPYTI